MITERETAYEKLKARLATIKDLTSAHDLLFWDQRTYMPEGGVTVRAEQMATLSGLAHEKLVDAEMDALLGSLGEPEPSSEEEALIRRARREYERAAKLPASLVQEMTRTSILAKAAWVKARERSDWSLFAPHLDSIVALNREAAEYWGYKHHIYDALLEGYEPGVTKAQLEAMFVELKRAVVPLIHKIAEHSTDTEERESLLYGFFNESLQERFARRVVSAFGFDWGRGRQDRSAHPFTMPFGPGDVRITTRFNENHLTTALFGAMHEAGHALYEQGIKPRYSRTPLGGGASLGIHESQSRLWENLVGRSRPFWSHYYPKLQKVFPDALGSVDLEAFYRAVNVVKPSPIRVEADEATYNLHIILRFELETDLLEGKLSVAELPTVWNSKMEKYLGIVPDNDAEGVLQDIHWSNGVLGYFPTYSIGNVLSVQFFDEAIEQQPEILAEIEEGEFAMLRAWLCENIYQHGSRYYPTELVERVTGHPIDTVPYVRYLNNKFGELYAL